ncbi:hypothetical protein [Salmonella phage SD-1_S14]|nr:hypothetical protein [Salmonella phage SD-1_S14]
MYLISQNLDATILYNSDRIFLMKSPLDNW